MISIKLNTLPIPNNENKRLAALEYYDILDTEAEKQFDRLTLLASEICQTPISLVSLIDGDRQWFKSRVGLGVAHTPREISFCQHAIMGEKVFEVENALEDDRFLDNPLVLGDPNIRFYAGHPLRDSSGFNLGTLCVIDRIPKKLSDYQKKALELLADEVVDAIESRKKILMMKQYQKFFDLSLDFMCVFGTDMFFKIMNPTFIEKLGYSEEELRSSPLTEFLHKQDRAKTVLQIHQLKKGHRSRGFENRVKKKDGEYIWLHWTFQPDAISEEIFASAHDITDLKVPK